VNPLAFPPGFLWGAATSAPQIEGAVEADGRGESIWDRFAKVPGAIEDASTPARACDHYRRWREDVEHLKWLGVGAYRFSIAWPRVMPARGVVNPAGLDFYDALVDALLEARVKPFVTLYHWDLPQAIQDQGGWASRDTVEAFARYVEAVVARLGDRVRHWVTHNEPWCTATLGYEEGKHAPGHADPAEALRVSHHLLLSHGRAMDVIRRGAPGAEAGIVLNLTPAVPASPDPGDHVAARRFDGFFNRWYLDPLLRGRYPEDVIADRVRRGHLSGKALPFVLPGDMETIATPMDFLGVNYYSRIVVRRGPDGRPVGVQVAPEDELTDMGWEVHPQGLEDLLARLHQDYAPRAIYITENGAAYGDGPDGAGRIADARRIAYLHDHLLAARRAIDAGVPLRGYFVWSLLDNFEWAHGYTKRFGLFWVDFETQRRIPKDSAYWYRDVVASDVVAEDLQPLSRRLT